MGSRILIVYRKSRTFRSPAPFFSGNKPDNDPFLLVDNKPAGRKQCQARSLYGASGRLDTVSDGR